MGYNDLTFPFLERFTKGAKVISTDHAYIHDGLAFSYPIIVPSAATAYNIGFTTPTVASGKYIHFRPLLFTSSAALATLSLYEANTFSAGTAITPINRNRISTATTNMQAFSVGVTATLNGTLIAAATVGTGGNPASLGGGSAGGEGEEMILKQNTSYVIGITRGGTTIVYLTPFWYEEGQGT